MKHLDKVVLRILGKDKRTLDEICQSAAEIAVYECSASIPTQEQVVTAITKLQGLKKIQATRASHHHVSKFSLRIDCAWQVVNG